MTLSFIDNRLGFRLVVISLLIGSVLSVFTTAIQLVVSYQRQKGDAVAILDQVEDTLLNSLEFALWTFDFSQVNILLDSLIRDEAVTSLHVSSETGHAFERGTIEQSDQIQVYALVHRSPDGANQTLGSFRVGVSFASIAARIWEQFWVTFLTNLTKAYLAALALFFVVHRLITRHLHDIVQHVETTDLSESVVDFQLDRTPGSEPDDLDRIVAAIHDFEVRTRRAVKRLQSEVKVRKKSEQDAHEALSVRSSFIGTMSHEVRTPLNSILGFLHLIETDKDVPDKQRQFAHVATKAAQQLLSQLTNVLEMSRLDSNAVTIATRPTDIRRLAKQWRDTALATVHFHQKSINVTLDLDDNLDALYMLDGARLTQVMTNLTDNAAKFTQSGDIQIRVRRLSADDASANKHGLEISVADTGEGIKDADRQSVFDRFVQSDAGIKRQQGGSGLGLTISQEVSELMGARLTLAPAERDGFSTRLLITFGCIESVEAHDA